VGDQQDGHGGEDPFQEHPRAVHCDLLQDAPDGGTAETYSWGNYLQQTFPKGFTITDRNITVFLSGPDAAIPFSGSGG
jgi:hypothetical protein